MIHFADQLLRSISGKVLKKTLLRIQPELVNRRTLDTNQTQYVKCTRYEPQMVFHLISSYFIISADLQQKQLLFIDFSREKMIKIEHTQLKNQLRQIRKYISQQIQFISIHIIAICNYNILMSGIQEKLYLQAQQVFSSEQLVQLEPGICCCLYTPTLRRKYSLRRFYILFNIYFLQKPKNILSYLRKSPPSQAIDIIEFLQALKSLSYIFRSNSSGYKNLKQAYEMILIMDQVKPFIANYCLIPENIGDFIEGLGLRKQSLIDLQTKIQEISPKINEKPSQEIIVGYTKVTVSIVNIKDSFQLLQLDEFWIKITSIAENHNLCYMKIFDIFMSSLFLTDNMAACMYVLRKYKKIINSQQMVKFLLSKMQKKYFQDGKLLKYENKKLIELQSLKKKNESIPNQQIFRTLALLIKAELIQFQSLFSWLTPSVKQIAQIQRQRFQIQQIYAKKFFKKQVIQSKEAKPRIQLIWGYLKFSSKLQFLNHLLLVNDFRPFKEIVTKNAIKIDLLYHPNILETLCDLFEWIIQPLYEQLGITHHFKGKKGFFKQFPEGYFEQVSQISNAMIIYLSQIIEIGKSYIFSRRINFIKICRIFKQICSKSSKLQFEQSDVNKKIVTYIANTVKRHILPAVQYYERDPSIVNELDRLMNSFKFKVQFQIYHECLKENQFLNLHLTVLKEETTSQLIKYLNRLTDTDTVINLISKFLVCRVFTTLQQIIFVRFQFISKQQVRKIIEAIKSTPKFTKKVSLFFVLIQLCEYQNDMVASDKDISKKYEHLITFTQSLLHQQNKNEQFIKIIFTYITYKLYNFNTDVRLLNNFDKFHGEIYFFEGLLENLLPIQLDDCSINQFDRKYLVGGPLLKIKLMKKIKQFNESRSLRQSMIKCFFKPSLKQIVQNTFYYIILKLDTIKKFIVNSLFYNVPTSTFFCDKFLKLILNIINIAHFHTNSAEISKYFNIKLFQPLVNYYGMSYEISFYITRKSLTQQMFKYGYDWNQQKNWKQLKEQFIPSLKKHLNKSKNDTNIPDQYRYSQRQINQFLDLDVFLLFWIQEPEYSLYMSFYQSHIDDLQRIIEQLGQNSDKNLNLFRTQLIKEKEKYAKIYYDLTYEKGSNEAKPRDDYNKRYIIFESEQYNLLQKFINFCKMFFKYCILPRAMLNKSESYYCSCFFLYFLKKNNLPIEISTKLICLLLQEIVQYVACSTQRESTQLLPLLYNSSMAPFNFWHNFAKFNDKLEKLQLIQRKMSFDVYNEVLFLLYQSQSKILNYFFELRKDVFRIKNSLNFLFKCQNIPFCSNHGQMIMNGFEEIKSIYKQHKDVIVMVESYTKQFQNKLSLTRSIQDSVKRRYDSKYNFNYSSSLNQTNPDIHYVKYEDPFDEYPNLSTSVDFQFSQTQRKQKYTSKKSNQKRSSPSVTFDRQIIEEQPIQQESRRKSGNNFTRSQKNTNKRSNNREIISEKGKSSQNGRGKSKKAQRYR